MSKPCMVCVSIHCCQALRERPKAHVSHYLTVKLVQTRFAALYMTHGPLVTVFTRLERSTDGSLAGTMTALALATAAQLNMTI